jgi:hypothetical protein
MHTNTGGTLRRGGRGGAAACLAALAMSLVAWAGERRDEPAAVGGEAARPPLPAGPVTLEAAIRRAVACSRELGVLNASLAAAEARVRGVTDWEDPELALRTAVDDGDALRLGVRLPLPNPWQRSPTMTTRTAERHAAAADVAAARWRIECDVRQAFMDVDYLTNDVALAAELVRLNGTVRSAVQARAEQGAATVVDLLAATRRSLRAEADLDQARERCREAQRRLAALLDAPAESLQIDAREALPGAEREASPADQLERVALGRRPDVAALRWRTAAAQAAYRAAWNVRLPWVTELNGSYRPDGGGDELLDEDTGADEWRVGLAVSVPVFSWTKNHADQVLLADWKVAAAREADGLQRMAREIRDAVGEAEERRRVQARYDREIAPLIADMRQTLATLAGAAHALPDQVAAAQAQIVESLRPDLECRWRYRLALLALERVVGAPLPVTPAADPAPAAGGAR